MKFQALKLDFLAYLEKILQNSGDSAKLAELKNGEISIFMYADEFKEYLNEKTDNVSIFSKSLSEVLSMDFSSDQRLGQTAFLCLALSPFSIANAKANRT